jgi:hypothetical protein
MSNSFKLTVTNVSMSKGAGPTPMPGPMPGAAAPEPKPYNAGISFVVSEGVGAFANANGATWSLNLPSDTAKVDIAVDDTFTMAAPPA